MKKVMVIVAVLLLIPVLMVLYSGLYTVQMWEQVVVIEFGKPVDKPITEAGLHWKTPFIQKLHRFDKRVLEFDGQATEIPTGDKKFIFVDTFARWRIIDPLMFYKTVVNELRARQRLNDIINSRTRDVISNYNLIELVRNSNRPLLEDQEVLEATQGGLQRPVEGDPAVAPDDPSGRGFSREALPPIEQGREAIAVDIRNLFTKCIHQNIKDIYTGMHLG